MIDIPRHVRVARKPGDVVSLILLSREQQRECKTLSPRSSRCILTRSRRFETMERELWKLQETLKTSEDQEAEKSPSMLPPLSMDDPGPDIAEADCWLDRLTASIQDPNTNLVPKSIDGVELDASMVIDILQEYVMPCSEPAVADKLRYYSSYHAQFPLLQGPVQLLESYNACPCLFWMVVALACKDHEKYAHLYLQLRSPIKRLAADHTVAASRSIFFVQALLLLCVWPFPFGAINEDPSWLYCGLAIHMAMLLGLHRPQHPFRLLHAADAEVGDLAMRTRTWLACFTVNQMYKSELRLEKD